MASDRSTATYGDFDRATVYGLSFSVQAAAPVKSCSRSKPGQGSKASFLGLLLVIPTLVKFGRSRFLLSLSIYLAVSLALCSL